MWDRRKGDTPAQPAAPGQTPIQQSQKPAPTPTAPVLPAAPRAGTAIGRAVTIIGDIQSNEDLYVDGEVQGRIEVRDCRLTVGPNGRAKSHVRAREVIIQGQVQGDVEATQKITIRKSGSLVGNIKTTGIIIEDDAYFKGSIDIVRKEPEPPAVQKEPETAFRRQSEVTSSTP